MALFRDKGHLHVENSALSVLDCEDVHRQNISQIIIINKIANKKIQAQNIARFISHLLFVTPIVKG